MEMNAANVAQHKTFHGKPSFVAKNTGEKSRFGELSTEEIEEIVDRDTIAVTTQRKESHKVRDDII